MSVMLIWVISVLSAAETSIMRNCLRRRCITLRQGGSPGNISPALSIAGADWKKRMASDDALLWRPLLVGTMPDWRWRLASSSCACAGCGGSAGMVREISIRFAQHRTDFNNRTGLC